ncbi:MAG: Flp pilus assembly protein CpaB [Rubripirellula sp.]|nr:Flp pilus assembly protein CpaB [Rubripirellula sp.]
MRNKSLYLLVACVCGTVAAILASQWLNAQANSGGAGTTTEIYVSTGRIEIGEKITPERIQCEQWPADIVPEGATGDLSALENKYAKQYVSKGEAIILDKLMEENFSTIPKGYKVVSMKASDVTIANLVQPGDRVDVVGYFTRSELIPRSMTKAVLMGIRVYSLDGDTDRKVGEDRPASFRNIELLIHEKDAEAWVYANELGNISLNLGSNSDYSNTDGSNEAGQEFLEWLENYRKQQDEKEEQKDLDQLRPASPAINLQQETKPEPEPKEEGFRMLKLFEGRIVEYWIVPGKAPVVIGEAGATGGYESSPSEESGGEIPPIKSSNDDHEFLNGEFSPFFESDGDPSVRN